MSASKILTTTDESSQLATILTPRLVEMGKVKIGRKGESRHKKNGEGTYRIPEKLDHFIVTTLQRDANDDLIPDLDLMAAIRDEQELPLDEPLRTLPISLLSNNLDETLLCKWRWYQGQRLAGESDGVTLTLWNDPRTRQALEQPRTLPWKPESGEENPDVAALVKSRAFKLSSVFSCMIRSKAAKFGGVYKFRSTSEISANQLYSCLTQLKELTCGILRMLPLQMVLRPVQVCPNGQPTTVYVVHVEMLGEDVQDVRRFVLDEVRKQLADAKEVQRMLGEFNRLVNTPGYLEADESELPQLPPASAPPAGPFPSAPPAVESTRAQQCEQKLRQTELTPDAVRATWQEIGKEWKQFTSAEKDRLNGVLAEIKTALGTRAEVSH